MIRELGQIHSAPMRRFFDTTQAAEQSMRQHC